MKKIKFLFISVMLISYTGFGQGAANANQVSKTSEMMIRIAEIELHPEFVKTYLAILKEEASASLRLEPGVLSIFPMVIKEDSTQIRILEIYADQAAYQAHLKTPHFQKYKTGTSAMVKSLKLVDMEAIDPEMIPAIFRKKN